MRISLIITVFILVNAAYGLAYLTQNVEYPVERPESIFISSLTSWIMGAIINTIFYNYIIIPYELGINLYNPLISIKELL